MCGNMLDCGGCAGGLTCGGGGVANQCGTMCPTVCPMGYSCTPQGQCIGGDPTGLVLNVDAVNVTGGVTLNGVPLVKTCSSASPATIIFEEINLGYQLSLNALCDATASFSGTVYPGTYKVSVKGTTFSNLPQGTEYIVHPSITLTNMSNTLPLDVQAVNVTGGVTLNLAQLVKSCSSASPATILFHEINKGYDLTLNSLCDATASFSGTVYPGTYKVSVQGTTFSNLPQGSPYTVHPSLAIQNANNALPLNVLAVNVNGGVALNSMPLVKSCSSASPATVLFHEVNQGYDLTLNSLCDATASFSGTVYPGTYQVSVKGTTFSNLPQGSPYTVHPTLAIQNASNMLPLNVLAVNVDGGVTLNGMPLMKTCSSASPATVLFHEVNQGYDLTLNSLCDATASYAGTVYPGTYKVSVAGTTFSNLPQGSPYTVHTARSIQNASNSLPLNVLAVAIAGSVTLNKAPPMRTCSSASPATVIFKELAQGYTLTMASVCDTAFSFAGTVYPGTYEVSVAGTSFSNLPQGSPFVAVDQLVVP